MSRNCSDDHVRLFADDFSQLERLERERNSDWIEEMEEEAAKALNSQPPRE
jgi:prolyl oligopeptidase PreP (S9A serine peptidase family)